MKAIATFFYRKTGIRYEVSNRYYVDKRILERMEATKSSDFRSYFTLLRFQSSGEELQKLTNRMTVNETYFLREEFQFGLTTENSPTPSAEKSPTWLPVFARRERISAE